MSAHPMSCLCARENGFGQNPTGPSVWEHGLPLPSTEPVGRRAYCSRNSLSPIVGATVQREHPRTTVSLTEALHKNSRFLVKAQSFRSSKELLTRSWRPIHHRMPVILRATARRLWLGEEKAEPTRAALPRRVPSATAIGRTSSPPHLGRRRSLHREFEWEMRIAQG